MPPVSTHLGPEQRRVTARQGCVHHGPGLFRLPEAPCPQHVAPQRCSHQRHRFSSDPPPLPLASTFKAPCDDMGPRGWCRVTPYRWVSGASPKSSPHPPRPSATTQLGPRCWRWDTAPLGVRGDTVLLTPTRLVTLRLRLCLSSAPNGPARAACCGRVARGGLSPRRFPS